MIEQKIRQSIVLDRVIPEYVLNEFPKFVEFIRAYYKWMENSGNSISELKNILSNKDIDTVTSDQYSFFILDTFLSSIPKNLKLDYAHLLHNIRMFYSEKGTDASIKAFFRLISESTRPSTVIVKFSDVEDILVGQTIRGSNSGALAVVNSATRLSTNVDYVLLSLSYSTEMPYKTRFFTSADEVILEDNSRIDISVEDFKVQIFYPKDYILRSSDGVYKQETRCRILLEEGRYRSFANKAFTTSSGSSGRIERQSYAVFKKNGYEYYDITLSFSIRRKWAADEKLYVDGEELSLATVFSGVSISDGGLGYTEGEQFSIVTNGEKIGVVTIGSVNKSKIDSISIINGGNGYSVGDRFSFKYSDGLYGGGYVRRVISGTITEVKIEHAKKNSSEYPEVVFDSGNSSATFSVSGSNVGSITTAYISDVGADVDEGSIVEIPMKELPLRRAVITLVFGTLYTTRKAFVDQRGELSSHFRMQDNFYWQDFSYVVQYTHPIDFSAYLDLYKKSVHPAGTKVFFEMRRTPDSSSMVMGTSILGERRIIKEETTHNKISDVQYQPINSIERIKDTNPLQTYMAPYYKRESLKTYIMDSYLKFPDLGATIDSFSDTVAVHEHSNTIDVREIYVKYPDGYITVSDIVIAGV